MKVILDGDEYELLTHKAHEYDCMVERVKNGTLIEVKPANEALNAKDGHPKMLAKYVLNPIGYDIACSLCRIKFKTRFDEVKDGEVTCPSCGRRLWLW